MTDGDLRVSGGGSVAVDTASMLSAARTLETAAADLRALAPRLGAAEAETPLAAVPLAEAVRACREAERRAADAAAGLRTAALRYGAAEEHITRSLSIAAADQAAANGLAMHRIGPLGAIGPLGGAVVSGYLALVNAIPLAVAELARTGHVAPQLDPEVLSALRLALSSSDDLLRGVLGGEPLSAVAEADPSAPLGTESIAAALGALLPAQGGALRTTVVDRAVVRSPRSLTGLAARIPEEHDGAPQIRVEAYAGADGIRRFIVYITGTVTFSPAASDEPFDARADLLGVADEPTGSEQAVLEALRAAGAGKADPVLLVGHSQGALIATRIAQHDGLAVAGVVTLGGPTGQIALPAEIPVLALEHTDDPVPVLGGEPADGEAGRRRIVVRRAAIDDLRAGPVVPGAGTHALSSYRRTMALAERSGDARIAAFARRLRPFLSSRRGDAVLVRAERRQPAPIRPARPRGGAAAGR